MLPWKKSDGGDVPSTGLLFTPAATKIDVVFAAALSAAFLALFLVRSPLWALPGVSASVASVAAGLDAPWSVARMPAILAAKAFAPLAGGPGAGVAASSAFFTALSCGAFFLALLSAFHAFIRPVLLEDEVRNGPVHAWFSPRLAALVGALAFGLCPSAERLAAGEVPESETFLCMCTALALAMHGFVSDRRAPVLAASALAGAAAGVSPLALQTLPIVAAPVVVAAFETESDRSPAWSLVFSLAAAAAGGLAAAAAAVAAFSAAQGAAGPGFAEAFADHAVSLLRCIFGDERSLGLEDGEARMALGLSLAPFVSWLFAARASLSERENRPALHVFNGVVLVVGGIGITGGPISPAERAAGFSHEPAIAALSATCFAYGMTAFRLQALYFFGENAFPEPPKWKYRVGTALRATLFATIALVLYQSFRASVREAPGRPASLWRVMADATIDSMEGRPVLRVAQPFASLVRLRARERGSALETVRPELPFPSEAGDPALCASQIDPEAWEDAGFPVIPSGIVFAGLADSAAAGEAAAAGRARWEAAVESAAKAIVRARRHGGTAGRAARTFAAVVASTGGEIARAEAAGGDPVSALRTVALARRISPSSPMLALDEIALSGPDGTARGIVDDALSRGGAAEAGLAEIAMRESRPVSAEADAFLAPGFVRAGRHERALRALDRAASAAPETGAAERAAVFSAKGRVRLLLGDRAGARADFETAASLSGGSDRQSAYALAALFREPGSDEDSEAALDAALAAAGVSPYARLEAKMKGMEERGIPVSARMRLDKAIRDDADSPVLRLMRLERELDSLAAAQEEDRRRWREAAVEDLDKLRENPGPWTVRVSLDATRLWILDGQTGLARSELADAARVHPDERRILAPLVAFEGALGLVDSRAEHLAALRRIDPAGAGAAEAAPPPRQDEIAGIPLADELFAAFPAGVRRSEFAGAAYLALARRPGVPDGDRAAFAACARAEFAKSFASAAIETPQDGSP